MADWEIAVIGMFATTIFLFVYASLKMEKAHYLIKLFLFLMAFVIDVLGMGTVAQIVQESFPLASASLLSLLDYAYFASLWTFIMVFLYLIVMYTIELFTYLGNLKKMKGETE